jgi:hypothetical protein
MSLEGSPKRPPGIFDDAARSFEDAGLVFDAARNVSGEVDGDLR